MMIGFTSSGRSEGEEVIDMVLNWFWGRFLRDCAGFIAATLVRIGWWRTGKQLGDFTAVNRWEYGHPLLLHDQLMKEWS